MIKETLPNEVCVTSYKNSVIGGIDFMSLEDLQEIAFVIPPGVFATVYSTPLQVH